MAACGLEVPKNEPKRSELHGFLMGAPEAARAASEAVQNGTFTGSVRGFRRVEKEGLPWYNLDSRQTNLSIRHFNNLKSFRRRSPEAGLGRVFGLVFKVWSAQF
jgi:hypothetical protein